MNFSSLKNHIKTPLFIYFLVLTCSLTNAQSFTISGKVKSSESGEVLQGVNIHFENSSSGVTSNEYGFYSLKMSSTSGVLLSSYLGFKDRRLEISISSDTVINIELSPIVFEINEVVISGNSHNNIRRPQMSLNKLSIQTIKRIPQIVGETDIIKSLQYLPGVTAANEGTNSISVRGGSFGQNLVMLDEAVLLNPNHALSLFSTFNPDAISTVDFYTSAFPAKYGGRLSSIIDVRMKEGNNKKNVITGGVGLLSSRLTIEGPIKKEKSSFILSGRYSYAGIIVNQVAKLNSIIPALKNFRSGNEINFYDLNGKFNIEINEKNHLFLSGYLGHDHFYFKNFSDNFSLDWGNETSTIRWNHIFGPKLFTNSTFVYSHYYYDYRLINDTRNFLWQARMTNFQLKSDFDYYANSKLKLSYGVFSGLSVTLPGKISPNDTSSVINQFSLNNRNSMEVGAYAELVYKIWGPVDIKIGARGTSFSEIGETTIYDYNINNGSILDSMHYSTGQKIKTFNNLEPRLLVNFILSPNSALKLSYTGTTQYYHLLSNSSIGMPTDIWIPSGKKIVPQESRQFNIGFYHDFFNDKLESSVEIYYKRMDHIIDFKDNADLFLNNNIEAQLLTGYAHAYGIEFYLKKDYGKIKGWISYSLSKVTNHIAGINNNKPYSPTYDKPHNLKVVMLYDLSKKWTFSSSFALCSGSNLTVPAGTFQYYGASFNYYTQRNAYRVPAFHQLDVSISYHPETTKKLQSEFLLSINNIYNRKNVFMVYSRPDQYNLDQSKTYKLYLYGIFPSVAYNFKF
jgi:hypothetical protein